MKPWLSVVVTCIGRPTLGRLIDSIPTEHGIEIIVVPDTHISDEADFTSAIKQIRPSYENKVRWLEYDAGYHNWGHPQRQYGDSQATGEWLLHSQDDNQFHPSAFTDIWFSICEQPYPRPILFKVHTWQAGTVWRIPELIEENVDADCIVCPNDPEKLGKWGDTYQGDYTFIKGTADFYNGDVSWNPNLIQWHAGKEDYSIPEFKLKESK